jgi:hypothetical protein
MLYAGEALFLIVAEEADAVLLRHFDQRDAAVVQAGAGNPRQINGFAAAQLRADRREALLGKLRVGAVEVPPAEIPFQRLLCDAMGECAQARMAWSGP